MKRTQIQLPDQLFAAARELARTKEISLAELVRRGLEYLLAVSPETRQRAGDWELPQPHALGSNDPFAVEGWRAQLHIAPRRVAEDRESYGSEEKP